MSSTKLQVGSTVLYLLTQDIDRRLNKRLCLLSMDLVERLVLVDRCMNLDMRWISVIKTVSG